MMRTKNREERDTARKRGYAFACQYCGETYATIEKAKACAKPLKKSFKPGDIVKLCGRIWRITHIDDGLYAESIPEYLRAFGYSHIRSYQQRALWYPRSYFCNNDVTLFNINDVRAQVKLRASQLKAAQKLLTNMESKHEQKQKEEAVTKAKTRQPRNSN